jgi:hypothetical protein
MSTTPLTIQVPDDLDFSALKLARDADGMVSFDWGPIETICAASGIDVDIFREAPEDNIAGLLTAWYAAHRQRGGAADPVQEDLIAEAALEDSRGGGISHAPGRA